MRFRFCLNVVKIMGKHRKGFDKTEDPKLNSGKLIRYMSRTMMRRSNSISVKEREKSIYGIKERKKEGNT